ncbi:MAG: hypothetical protein HQL26_05545 [Candidatus Omnitrophica bacterium]|nr:hypothetical protein [Candidatus Omnitrophota bacterium]
MKNILTGFLLFLFFCGCASAKDQKTPRLLNDFEKKFIATDFELKGKKSELNSKIIALLTLPPGIAIADQGEKFNDSDVVNPGLPMNGILFAGESKDMAFVFYAQGGFVYTERLLIAELNNTEVVRSCAYTINRRAWCGNVTLEELKAEFPYASTTIEGLCK